QGDAVCGDAGGDRRGQRRESLRHADPRGAREGPGRRPRVGDPRAADDRARREVDPRRHADSAQWMPATEEAAGLKPAAGSWYLEATRIRINGTLHRTGLPAVPARRDEALPERGALLHGEVRDREAQPPAGPARQAAQGEAGGLRPAAP